MKELKQQIRVLTEKVKTADKAIKDKTEEIKSALRTKARGARGLTYLTYPIPRHRLTRPVQCIHSHVFAEGRPDQDGRGAGQPGVEGAGGDRP